MSNDYSSSDINNTFNGFSSNNDINSNQQLNASNEQDVRNAPINSLNNKQTLLNCTNQSINNDEYEQILSSTSSSEHNIIYEEDKCPSLILSTFICLSNIDRLPLYKSSLGQAILILVSIVNVPELQKIVFPIRLYYGFQKPKEMDDFLNLFVLETIELSEKGFITANSTKVLVKILSFVCDAPAKKYILGIEGHGGY
jgi:hypothetical protein